MVRSVGEWKSVFVLSGVCRFAGAGHNHERRVADDGGGLYSVADRVGDPSDIYSGAKYCWQWGLGNVVGECDRRSNMWSVPTQLALARGWRNDLVGHDDERRAHASTDERQGYSCRGNGKRCGE